MSEQDLKRMNGRDLVDGFIRAHGSYLRSEGGENETNLAQAFDNEVMRRMQCLAAAEQRVGELLGLLERLFVAAHVGSMTADVDGYKLVSEDALDKLNDLLAEIDFNFPEFRRAALNRLEE